MTSDKYLILLLSGAILRHWYEGYYKIFQKQLKLKHQNLKTLVIQLGLEFAHFYSTTYF